MESITAILIVAIIFITFYKVIDLYVRRKERIMMIEKCESLKDASPIFQDFFGGGLFVGLGVGFVFELIQENIAFFFHCGGFLFRHQHLV